MSISTTSTAVPQVSQGRLQGLGGWLSLVGIGQVLGPIRLLVSLGSYYASRQTQAAFAQAPLALGGELALNIACFVFVIFCAYAFFARKRYFPLLFVLEVASGPALVALDALWVSATTSVALSAALDADDMLTSILISIPGALWIIYMYKSSRVRNTFVN